MVFLYSCDSERIEEIESKQELISLENITTGSGNTCIGDNAGTSYNSSESDNILIGRGVTGTIGESNVIRIGTIQTNTFIKGIHGITPAGGTKLNVIIDSDVCMLFNYSQYLKPKACLSIVLACILVVFLPLDHFF